jgi:hypothetical protein
MTYKKLKEGAKEEIRKAFEAYAGSGIPETHLLRLVANHAIGLLELPSEVTSEWYEPSAKPVEVQE